MNAECRMQNAELRVALLRLYPFQSCKHTRLMPPTVLYKKSVVPTNNGFICGKQTQSFHTVSPRPQLFIIHYSLFIIHYSLFIKNRTAIFSVHSFVSDRFNRSVNHLTEVNCTFSLFDKLESGSCSGVLGSEYGAAVFIGKN